MMNKPKKTIAIDLDDVLAANAEGFTNFSNKRWGTNLTKHDFQEDMQKMWGIEHKAAQRRFNVFVTSDTVSGYQNFAEARPVLEKLRLRYRLIIVTSRRSKLKEPTAAWVAVHFRGLFEEIHHTGFYDTEDAQGHLSTKGDICREIGANYLIDDHAKHCVAAAEAGLTALLFGDYAWNRSQPIPDAVSRVADWQAVEGYFDAQG